MNKHPIDTDEVIDPQLLGDLLEAVPPQSPPPGLRAKVLARALGASALIDAPTATPNNASPFDGFVDRFMSMFDVDAEQARGLLKKAAALDADPFEPCGIPGTQLFYFHGGPRTAQATCGFLRIAAGAIFPAHEHQGDEHVIVLQGAATEHSGRRYHAGDVIHCQKGTRHSFRADGSGPLIFAVLLEKPNKWLAGQIILDYVFKKRRFEGGGKK